MWVNSYRRIETDHVGGSVINDTNGLVETACGDKVHSFCFSDVVTPVCYCSTKYPVWNADTFTASNISCMKQLSVHYVNVRYNIVVISSTSISGICSL